MKHFTAMKLKSILSRRINSGWMLLLSLFIVCTNLYSAIIVGPPPPTPLTILFNSPTSAATYSATSGTIDVAGYADDDFSTITNVAWSNDRGGNGEASGTFGWHTWTVDGIALKAGQNVITCTVSAANGTTSTATLTVYLAPPTVSITTPISGQRWNSPTFTVNGTASDISQIGGVFYQLNNGAWENATGTTNWSATVNLVPGTNMIKSYAVDISGNPSLTNSVSFDFVVTNQLKVSAIGLGKISPNYSNVWLEIGRNYSIMATPATHFAFKNWAISTNWIDGIESDGATVQFMMQSNLTIQVQFAEINNPTLTISTPKANKKETSPLLNVTGKASDVWGVASVWYQLNGGTWNLATTTDGWKNWSATVPLTSGTDKISAYSVNLGGNMSPIKSVSVQSSDTFKMQLGFASPKPMASNGLNLILQASPGLSGVIQVSTDMMNWQTLTNFVGSDSAINFRDSAATNYNQRFYRAITSMP